MLPFVEDDGELEERQQRDDEELVARELLFRGVRHGAAYDATTDPEVAPVLPG